jgi:hypothetical protein
LHGKIRQYVSSPPPAAARHLPRRSRTAQHVYRSPDLTATLTPPDHQESYALIHRILPNHATSFIIESLPAAAKDSFELESRGNKIILRGNNGVAVASALYYYLKTFATARSPGMAPNLRLPNPTPGNKNKIGRQLSLQGPLLPQLLHLQLQHELVGLAPVGKRDRLDGPPRHQYAAGHHRRRIYLGHRL